MKKESTFRKGMPALFLIAGMIFVSMTLEGQVSHQVTVSNFSFSPKELTVNKGDTVVWTNTSGSHNVNGTTTTYPSNPESFGNNVGTGWTYSYVFNTPGTYDYRCDPHFSLGMTGKIIVQQVTGLPGTTTGDQILLYPNPAIDKITVDLRQTAEKLYEVRILDIVGREKLSSNELSGSDFQSFDITGFDPGIYLMRVETTSGLRLLKFIVK